MFTNKIPNNKKAVALLDNAVREYAGCHWAAISRRVTAYVENP